MSSLLISTKNSEELQLIKQLLKKINIGYTIVMSEKKEDAMLSKLMRKINRSKKVSRRTIMKKLTSQRLLK